MHAYHTADFDLPVSYTQTFVNISPPLLWLSMHNSTCQLAMSGATSLISFMPIVLGQHDHQVQLHWNPCDRWRWLQCIHDQAARSGPVLLPVSLCEIANVEPCAWDGRLKAHLSVRQAGSGALPTLQHPDLRHRYPSTRNGEHRQGPSRVGLTV